MYRRALVVVLAFIALSGFWAPAQARTPWDAGAVPVAQQRERVISASAAARRVKREIGGRILGVHRVREGNRLIYRVKVLTRDGHVRIFRVDARTGRIL